MSNISWPQIEVSFRDLFLRQWYTNQGPLAQEFENRLQTILNVDHVICVVNQAIALTMVLESIKIQGPVQLHGKPHANIYSALHWSNYKLCDKSITPAAVLSCGLKSSVYHAARSAALNAQCALIVDATQCGDALSLHSLAGHLNDGAFSRSFPMLAVLSFQRGQVIQAQGAACIATSNAELAEILRNIRSSYGVRETVSVVKTANGRMSEAQAAFGLLSIDILGRSIV